MKVRHGFDLPAAQEHELKRARRLEWLTIFFMATIVIVIYLTMGSSQAMKAAWIEDMLSFVAPIAFLVSLRYRDRAPDREFPYGYHRSVSIAFLAGAVALSIFGVYILYDSVMGLVQTHHPTIGTTILFGHQIWAGWLMIAALTYSAIPPMVLGHMKTRPAHELHDKTLKADADMNRADWMTALAGIAGITGIGLGLWWADSVAAGLISLSIVSDGFKNLKRVVGDLMDQRPRTVDGDVSDVPELVRAALTGLDWVHDADIRLREEGHTFTGEAFLTIGSFDSADLPERLQQALEVARAVDWRVHDIVFTVIPPHSAAGRQPTAGKAGAARGTRERTQH